MNDPSTNTAPLAPSPSLLRFRYRSILLAVIIVVAGAALIWGMSRGGARHSKHSALTRQISELPIITSEVLGGLPENVAALHSLASPRQDDWEVETFETAASAQLQQLGALVAGEQATNAQAVRQLAVDGFLCSSLRPALLQAVVTQASFTVLRPAVAQDATIDQLDLSTAIKQLAKPFEAASDVRVKFKIVRVDLNANTADTDVLYQSTGHSAHGAVQQQATWHCRWIKETSGMPRLTSIGVTEYEEVVNNAEQPVWFSERTAAVLSANPSYSDELVYGIDHWRGRLDRSLGVSLTGHHGIAIGDVNGDGLDDLYLCQAGGVPNRLFVQNLDGTATDVSAQAGVDWLDVSNSALFVDFDNDGDQDLVVGVGDAVLFMSNDGSGRFTRRRRVPTNFSVPMSLAAADYDRDGYVDLYVCLYNATVNRPQLAGSTDDSGETGTSADSTPSVFHDANNGAENILLRNFGNWVFSFYAKRAGLDVNNRRFSFSAAWEDFDNDGDDDLYVANDFGRNNLYRNDDGKFVDLSAKLGVEDIAAGMSACWGDYNNDGLMDLYVGNMFSAAGKRVAFQDRFHSSASDTVRRSFRRHARGNSLFANAGDGSFRDVSLDAAVSMGRWAWGSIFVDINNDGREDLFVANGYVTQENEADL